MSTGSKQAVLTNLLLIATCRLQDPNLKKATEYAAGLVYIRGLNKLFHPERAAKRGPANRALGKALSKASRSLRNLSATFLVDAQDFFADFWPPNY